MVRAYNIRLGWQPGIHLESTSCIMIRAAHPPVHGNRSAEGILLIFRDLGTLGVAGCGVAEFAHAAAAKRLAGVGTRHGVGAAGILAESLCMERGQNRVG